MRRIHRNNILGESQDSFRLLILGHDGPQIRHGLAVFVRVRDGSERVGPAVILGDGDDVGPIGGVGVGAHFLRGGGGGGE